MEPAIQGELAMNADLRKLAEQLDLDAPGQRLHSLRFAQACVERVKHQLEEEEAFAACQAFCDYLDGRLDEASFEAVAAHVLVVANQHRGSKSIDGSQHAAVSATYALAKAINCKP